MKATIVIPVKNSLPALLRNLNSLKSQNSEKIAEVIIVENGSQQISELPQIGLKLKLFHLKEGNRSAARNLGAKEVTTEFLVFLDSDVVLEANWIQNVLGSFDADTLAVQTPIIPRSYTQDNLLKLRKARAFYNYNHSFFSLKHNLPEWVVLNSAAFAIRTEVFRRLNGFDEKLYRQEDLDFTQRLLEFEGSMKAINSSSCGVYFDAGILQYFLREFNCGHEVVRYHQKWSEISTFDVVTIWVQNLLKLIRTLPDLGTLDQADKMLILLRFINLMGNFTGMVKRVIYPYPESKKKRSITRAKVIFE